MKIKDVLTYQLFERNVANVEAVDAYVKKFQNELQNPNAKDWVKSNFRNWLIKTYDDSTPVQQAKPTDPDWLQAAIDRGDDVININLNKLSDVSTKIKDFLNSEYDTGSKDLSRISVEQMQMLHDKWVEQMNKAQTKKGEVQQIEKGLKEIYRFEDGFRIVKLLSPEMKKREGAAMGHCVGSSCYIGKTIFSLFDPNNNPHATLQIEGNKVTQIQGKGNTDVVEKYWLYLRKFFTDVKYKIDDYYMKKIGLVKINRKTYEINNLPDNLKVNGNLNISYTNITELPNNIQVGGHLNLSNTKITQLPDNLKVGGNLHLSGTKITQLPDNLKVGGFLELGGMNITELPNNLQVGGRLLLSNTKITQLPDNLKVGGINLSNTKITQLPDNLKVGGHLELYDSNIIKLPDNLKVDGDLDLENSKITELPNNLQVGGNLIVARTPLANLPRSYFLRKNLANRGIKIGGSISR